MIFDCSSCRTPLEVEDEWAGHTLNCPVCGQTNVAPDLAPAAPLPRAKAKPAARPDRKQYKINTGRGGFWKFLGVALLVAAGAFLFTMYHFQEQPAQTWARWVADGKALVVDVEGMLYPKAPPVVVHPQAPTPVAPPIVRAPTVPAPLPPKPVAPPQPPDPLTWLAAHPKAWPAQVVLKSDTDFSILLNGAKVGSGVVPGGDSVSLVGISMATHTVTVACVTYGNSTREVPIAGTNLADLAKSAFQASLAPAPVQPSVSSAVKVKTPILSLPPEADVPLANTALPSSAPGMTVGITVNRPILLFQADAQGNSVTQAELSVQAKNFTPNRYSWAQVADRINPLNAKGTAVFSTNDSASASTTATFSAPGVYQIQLTATDGKASVTKNTWINVWDSTPVLNPSGKLGAYPDITPPPSVRNLSPDPGAFQHPRVLFTDSDWPEVSARDKTGRVASLGVSGLRKMVSSTLDDSTSSIGALASKLDSYAKADYQGTPPDINGVEVAEASGAPCMLGSNPKNIYNVLLAAVYLTWIDQDPTVPQMNVAPNEQDRRKYLARVVAAMARLEFNSLWDRATNTFHTDNPNFIAKFDQPGQPIDVSQAPMLLALCYDFIYPWMDEGQRKDVRDFLYALSYGRHFSDSFGGNGPTAGQVRNAFNQNGDFGNLNDFAILMAMAVDGEQSAVSPDVVAAFGTPRGDDAARIAKWMQPSPSDDLSAWPTSTVASVDNFQRQLNMINQWFISPWGFTVTNIAYLGLTTSNYLPATLALSHRGENAFVTSYIYNGIMAEFYTLQASEGKTDSPLASTNIFEFDHHDGGRGRPFMYFAWKYMFPDDSMVDYVYRTYLPGMFRGGELEQPLLAAMFGLDPGINGKELPLEDIAAQKKLPLLKFDPVRGVVVAHNGWKADDLSIWFDDGWNPHPGHCHAERNSFSLFALGRVWTCAPGYHCTISDLQTSILIQNPALVSNAPSDGYIGESPSSATQEPPLPGNFPPLPGRLLEVSESPDKQSVLIAGDATVAYEGANQAGHSAKTVDSGFKIPSFMYPGVMDYLNAQGTDIYEKEFDQELLVSQMDYNPVQYAIRSVLFVRGQRPYVLVVDDFKKDDAPHNYRWSMNDTMGFAPGQDNRFIDAQGHGVYSSLAMMPDATSTQATFYHSPVDDGTAPGLPRLLIRDVSEQDAAHQPPIILQSRPPGESGLPYLTYGIDNNHKDSGRVNVCSNRLLIERDSVVDPRYKILLFPYRTGEDLPVTTWSDDHTQLKIDLGNGTVDTITFSPNADHRTRLSFSRVSKS